MQFTTITTLACLIGSTFSAAIVNKSCVDYGYATFYDDHNCGVNPSITFSMGNDRCIPNETGRNSIYVQAPCCGNPYMVWTARGNCGCQNDCDEVPDGQGCWDLTGHAYASSFRFIQQSCGGKNCQISPNESCNIQVFDLTEYDGKLCMKSFCDQEGAIDSQISDRSIQAFNKLSNPGIERSDMRITK